MKKLLHVVGAAAAFALACLSADAQVFTKFGASTGVMAGSTATYQTHTATLTELDTALSQSGGAVLGGASGGAKGTGSINATALFINGAAVGTSSGAVSSVGLSVPTPSGACLGVTGSPVTAAGTLGLTSSGSSSQVLRGDTSCNAINAADINGLSPTLTGTWTWSNASNSISVFKTTTAADVAEIIVEGATGSTAELGLCSSNTAAACESNESAGDTNLFHTGTLHISTQGGTDQLTISAAGNLAIPAPSSGAPFTIAAGTTGGLNAVTAGAATNAGFEIAGNGNTIGSTSLFVGQSSVGDAFLFQRANAPVHIGTNNVSRIDVAATGGVTVNTPSSGVGLIVNGLTANNTIQAVSTGAASSLGMGWNQGLSSNQWNIYTQSTDPLTVGTAGAAGLALDTNSAQRLTINSTGSVTVNAPSSGTAAQVNGVANANTLVVSTPNTASQSFGMSVGAGTNSSDYNTLWQTAAGGAIGRIYGDGGFAIGAPTGGDKGVGSINAQSIFVNNVPVVTGSGSSQQIASVFGNCTSSGCTAANAKGISTTITRNSPGNYTVTLSPAFSAQPACVVSSNGVTGGIGTFLIGGTASGTVETFVAAVATDMAWSLVCTG